MEYDGTRRLTFIRVFFRHMAQDLTDGERRSAMQTLMIMQNVVHLNGVPQGDGSFHFWPDVPGLPGVNYTKLRGKGILVIRFV